MAKKSCSLSKVYGLLEPGPVVLITTASKGRSNVMTQSWHTMLEFGRRCWRRSSATAIIRSRCCGPAGNA